MRVARSVHRESSREVTPRLGERIVRVRASPHLVGVRVILPVIFPEAEYTDFPTTTFGQVGSRHVHARTRRRSLMGPNHARAILEWEAMQGTSLLRVGAAVALAAGVFLAFALTGPRPASGANANDLFSRQGTSILRHDLARAHVHSAAASGADAPPIPSSNGSGFEPVVSCTERGGDEPS